MEKGYKCIIAIVNSGFAEEAMEAAKACGARGGTILHGRGTISKEAEKLFNIFEWNRLTTASYRYECNTAHKKLLLYVFILAI